MGNDDNNQYQAPVMVAPQAADNQFPGAPSQPTMPRQTSAAQPLMPATAPAVAGLQTVPDLRNRRLIGVSVWALALGSCGLMLGIIGMIRTMGDVPGWFEPAFVVTGVVGLALIVAGFVTVQYRKVPWLLLGASTVLFVIGVVLLGAI